MPSILTVVKDSGVIEVTLEEDEQVDEKRVEVQDKTHQGSEGTGSRCHQQTQTDLLFYPSVGGIQVKKTMKENDLNPCGSIIQMIILIIF